MHRKDIIYVAVPARPANEVFYYLIYYKDLKLSKQAVLPGPGSAIFFLEIVSGPLNYSLCAMTCFSLLNTRVNIISLCAELVL